MGTKIRYYLLFSKSLTSGTKSSDGANSKLSTTTGKLILKNLRNCQILIMFKKILFILDGKEKKRIIFFGFFSILIIFLDFLSLTLIIPVVETILDPNSISKYKLGKISSLISDNAVIYVLFAFNFIIILKNILLFFVQKYQVHFISEYNQKLQVKIFKSYFDLISIHSCKRKVHLKN